MAEKSEIIDIDPTSTISDELLLHLVESQELVTEIILEREMIEEQENVSEEEDVQLQFIPDPEHTVVMGEQPAPSAEKKSTKKPKVYNCQKCKKKYATESRYNKHVNECKGLNAKSKKKGKKSQQQPVPEKQFITDEQLQLYETTFTTDIFIKALGNAAEDKIFNLIQDSRSKGNRVVDLAKALVEHKDREEFLCYVNYISKKIQEVVFLKMCTVKERVSQCATLHNLLLDKPLKKEWQKFILTFVKLVDYGPEVVDMLHSYMCKECFKLALEWFLLLTSRSKEKSLNTCMTPREVKVLRYVAGYIPFCLVKRFRNKDDLNSKLILQLIDSWRGSSDPAERPQTFLEYTNTWTDKINRGGLFIVNDKFFKFIRTVEDVARSIFNKQLIDGYSGEDLRDVLMKKFDDSSDVDSCWNFLVENFDNDGITDSLKEIILRKWVDIRARSFANAWIQSIKRNAKTKGKKPSTKGEPSLRKTLNVSKR